MNIVRMEKSNKSGTCLLYEFNGEIGIKHCRFHTKANKSRFFHEIEMLQLLEENFINEPKIKHYPFPRLITTDSCTIHKKCKLIKLTHCGITAVENIKFNIVPVDLHNTVECIINNLKNNYIQHIDMKGDNICINNDGYISLIDFERCIHIPGDDETINRYYMKPNLKKLKNKLYNHVGCAESDNLIEKALCTPGDPFLKQNKSGVYFIKKRPSKLFATVFKNRPWTILFLFNTS